MPKTIKKPKIAENRPLFDRNGNQIGKIVRTVYEPDRKKIKYALVKFGQPYSSEKRLFAVTWEVIQFSEEGDAVLNLDINEDRLAKAQPLDEENREEVKEHERLTEIYLLTSQRQAPR